MDLAGIRIITLVEDDLNEVEELIRRLFRVHEEDSGDKSVRLGHEKFGYRSRHFICDMGPKREELIELDHFKGMKFEIQIRTALAHAWAEIEHDRGYKLEGGLPENFKRRLNIVAAMLEGADNEFNRLTKEINEYTGQIKIMVDEMNLDIEVSSIGIQELLKGKYFEFIDESKRFGLQDNYMYKGIKEELEHFNVKTIRDVDIIIQNVWEKFPDTKNLIKKAKRNDIGFLRNLLILSDIEHYFKQKNLHWSSMSQGLYEILTSVYGEDKVGSLVINGMSVKDRYLLK